MEICIKLDSAPQAREWKDIDVKDLMLKIYHDVKDLSRRLESSSRPWKVLGLLCELQQREGFPNLYITLKIFNPTAIGVTSEERSCSKPKLRKTYLRTAMTQERLTELVTFTLNMKLCKRFCKTESSWILLLSAKSKK